MRLAERIDMWLVRLLAAAFLALALVGVVSPAHAQLVRAGRPPAQARQTIGAGFYQLVTGGGFTGFCARSPFSGAVLQGCADTVAGSYTADGVTNYTTLVAAGGTQPAGCVITASKGMQCSGTNVAKLPTAGAAASVLVVRTYGTDGAASAGPVAAVYGGPSNAGPTPAGSFNIFENNNGAVVAGNNGSAQGSASAAPANTTSTTAICSNGTTYFTYSTAGSAAGSAAQSTVTTPFTLYLANSADGSSPGSGSSFFTYAAAVYGLGGSTCNAALVQAAATATG